MPWLPTWLRHVWTWATLTPGAGTWDPSRKIATIIRTNSSLRRRSGVRKALAKAPSTRSSQILSGRAHRRLVPLGRHAAVLGKHGGVLAPRAAGRGPGEA